MKKAEIRDGRISAFPLLVETVYFYKQSLMLYSGGGCFVRF